jgi:hypothetical protein
MPVYIFINMIFIISNQENKKKSSIHNNNPLNAKLNPICHLLALLGVHPILHVSWIRVNRRNKHDHHHHGPNAHPSRFQISTSVLA